MLTKTLLMLASLLTGGAPAAPAQTPARAALQAAETAGPSAPAQRLDADAVVARVQAFYVDAQRLTALFRQTYTNTTFGKQSVSDGKLWIKKPGKMRWDYRGNQRKVNKSFISDGTTLWAVEHDNKQVFKKNLEEDMLPVAVTFLYGKGDLARDFKAALDTSGKYGKKSDYVLELSPRAPSAQYKTLYLVVDPGNFRVKESIVIEASGNTNHFRFFSPDIKAPVQDSWFVFNEKQFKNYRVVEGEAPPAGSGR
jgi:outer membrane lipoprotein carrier protein